MGQDQEEYLERLGRCKEASRSSNCKACGEGEKNVRYYECKVIKKVGKTVCICEKCYRCWARIQIQK